MRHHRSSRSPQNVFDYDEIPPGYYHERMLHGHPVQRFWHREKFRDVVDRIQDGERVLDLGCGPGSFLRLLTDEKPNIEAVGADAASPQLDYARELLRSTHARTRTSFELIDSSTPRLPFPDESFGVITSIELIEHLRPHAAEQILCEARRVLQPSGRLLVTTPNYRSLWPIIEWWLERLSPVKYRDQHVRKFTAKTLVEILEANGFQVVRLDSIFVTAPFLAGASARLAGTVHSLERRCLPRLGSLLVAEARKGRTREP